MFFLGEQAHGQKNRGRHGGAARKIEKIPQHFGRQAGLTPKSHTVIKQTIDEQHDGKDEQEEEEEEEEEKKRRKERMRRRGRAQQRQKKGEQKKTATIIIKYVVTPNSINLYY